jgi:hypothetical protein
MPLEQRKIILSQYEVQQALDSFRRTSEYLMPTGRVKGFFLENTREKEPELIVSLECSDNPHQPVIDVTVKGHQLSGMLIKFCLENNIPIPRKSQRQCCLVDGKLALSIEYQSEFAY